MRLWLSHLYKDEGITLLEIIATLLVIAFLMPAVYMSYATMARASETNLLRLRCLGIARQELELRKSEGYDKLEELFTGEETEVVIEQENFGDSGINLITTIEKTTVTDIDEVYTVDAMRVSVIAAAKSTAATVYAIVVPGGY